MGEAGRNTGVSHDHDNEKETKWTKKKKKDGAQDLRNMIFSTLVE